jgi:hypothetical protein
MIADLERNKRTLRRVAKFLFGIVALISLVGIVSLVYMGPGHKSPFRTLAVLPELLALAGASSSIGSLLLTYRSRTGGRLARAPGWRLLWLLGIAYSKTSVTRVFAPIVADMQAEFFDSLSKKEHSVRRFFIRMRGYGALASAAFPQALYGLIKRIVELKRGKVP